GESSNPEWAKDELYIGGRALGLRENKRPAPPLGVSVSGSDPVVVSWLASPEGDVVSYNVYRRRTNLGESWGPVGLGLVTTAFSDPGPFPNGTVLNYQITAFDSAGSESLVSPTGKLVIGDVTPPPKPVLTVQAGDREVRLSWV